MSHSAVLQWRPVLSASSDFYELRYNSVWKTDPESRHILPGDSSWMELTSLHPDTTYTASLHAESNQGLFSTLYVNFTTLSGERNKRGCASFQDDLNALKTHISCGKKEKEEHFQRVVDKISA